ncbi:oxaloacetate decarboxylase [Petrotoga sp. HKA.pet.4.5]|uniref:pyruvate carboxylase subunit B n=1 Tax=unclassified Petrotoga TaxID=2620614 RepID=UPI000EF149F3|nr:MULTISPECIES: pyruvate carboxylase subunit B [unclassified Petrotoga]RLL85394.1 oxaloacetate decarboxylase [Petrotoga sp. Shatin.DS.tank11.9.2.9.3]RLL88997.1 oxaloacetate decarboxylase [Petrotoga sp. HKA.pet.4.5]
MNKKPYIVDTTLRDGQQSLIATRLKMDDFEDQLTDFDQVGYYSMEVWGGATYDSCIRYLNEDPWQRLKTIRAKLKNTKIQMLLRGQNLVGYRNYADDVVELFVNKVADYSMDIIRVFDALNDIRNLEKSIEVAKKRNIHVQAAICYTVSPVHNLQYYLNYTKELVERGVDSIVIKDMAGLLKPKDAYDLVKEIKKKFNILVDIHSHATTGLASMAYFAGVEAGADILDLALSPFANGTSEPAVEPFVYTYDLDLDTKTIMKLVEYFWKVRSKYSEYDVKMESIDARILNAQIPGGMLSNLVSQLKSQKAEDKLSDVLQEVPKVRKDLGYPPLVTPTSQIVGVQAVLNVLTGKRYSMITNEVKNYLKGLYGKPPAPVDEGLYKLALGNEKPIDYRPADDLEPELEKAKKEIGILAQNDEDLLTYVLFKEVGKKFLKNNYVRSLNIDLNLAESFQNEDTAIYPV